jgi:hypothetical protein
LGTTSSIDFCSYDTLVDTTLIESSGLAPIVTLDLVPEHKIVKTTHATQFCVAPRHALA